MKKELSWVDLREAIRITVRLMSNGEQLATFIDDDWIISGGDSYCGEYKDGKNPFMVKRYGEDYQEIQEKVSQAYDIACATLKDVLSRSLIAGEGHCEGEIGRRSVTESEWEHQDIQLSRCRLLASRAFPLITGILIKASDVRRECEKAIAASSPEVLAGHRSKGSQNRLPKHLGEKLTAAATPRAVVGQVAPVTKYGRRPGENWLVADELVFGKMKAEVDRGITVTAAANKYSKDATGSGTADSKATRLRKSYRDWAAAQKS
jgi:hypothetical protein